MDKEEDKGGKEAYKDIAKTKSQEGGDASGETTPSPYYRYDDQGVLIYTDPNTKKEFVLNRQQTEWISKEAEDNGDPSQYDFDGETYRYEDKEGNKFKWDQDKKEWKQVDKDNDGDEDKKGNSSSESELDESASEEDKARRPLRKRKAQPGWGGKRAEYHTDPETGAQLYRDAADGMIYEWDREKSAWFPRIDEDFMAQYQMNYGFTADGKAEPTRPEEPKEEEEAPKEEPDKKKAKAQPQWFEEDEQKSCKVYVSNLPEGTTEEQVLEFVSKCGMVEVDVRSNKPKLKVYRDAEGRTKGDALCTYVKVESVGLALQILDGARMGDKTVKVERAKFEMKGCKYDPKLKPKKLRKKELEALKRKHEKMFAWEPDKLRGERSKRDKVIVVRNLFEPSDFDLRPELILEYSNHLRDHCAKFGSVRRVVLYDKHRDGVAQVFFSTPAEADQAVAMLDGRMFFNKRVMSASTWDGKTKFKVEETEEEERRRLENWDKFLEGEDEEEKEGEKKSEGEKAQLEQKA